MVENFNALHIPASQQLTGAPSTEVSLIIIIVNLVNVDAAVLTQLVYFSLFFLQILGPTLAL